MALVRPRAWRSRCRRVSACRPACATSSRSCSAISACRCRRSGHLGSWARQGVLLAQHHADRRGQAGRRATPIKVGKHSLTLWFNALIGDGAPKVFMLWGTHAQAKAPLIDSGQGPLAAAVEPSVAAVGNARPGPLHRQRALQCRQPLPGCARWSADRLANRLTTQRLARPLGRREHDSVLYSPVRRGGVPEWLKGADCKSVGLRLRWFESSLLHQAKRKLRECVFDVPETCWR